MNKPFLLINFGLFQASWWAAALWNQYASALIACFIAIHFLLSPTRRSDAQLLLVAALGMSVDQCLAMLGVLEFEQAYIPLWLVLLWGSFALCLHHSCRWLNKLKLWQVALLGGIFGSLSYVAAINLGVFTTTLTTWQFVLIDGACWLVLLPAMVIWAKSIDSSEGIS